MLQLFKSIAAGTFRQVPPGTLRWTGSDFEAFTGLFWISLTSSLISNRSNTSGGSILQIDGPLRIGNTNQINPARGTVRWTGGNFEGWNGVYWVSLTDSPLRDVEGTRYQTIVIGAQEWMKENLRTALYNDGETIQEVADNASWSSFMTGGAFCWYGNDKMTNENVYGKLYNWYAVVTDKLCPEGWRVPTQSDWNTLAASLGASAGGDLKESGLVHWDSPNTGATNSSGFTGLPGGARSFNGTFNFQKQFGPFWTRSLDNSGDAWMFSLGAGSAILTSFLDDKRVGGSVRCVRN